MNKGLAVISAVLSLVLISKPQSVLAQSADGAAQAALAYAKHRGTPARIQAPCRVITSWALCSLGSLDGNLAWPQVLHYQNGTWAALPPMGGPPNAGLLVSQYHMPADVATRLLSTNADQPRGAPEASAPPETLHDALEDEANLSSSTSRNFTAATGHCSPDSLNGYIKTINSLADDDLNAVLVHAGTYASYSAGCALGYQVNSAEYVQAVSITGVLVGCEAIARSVLPAYGKSSAKPIAVRARIMLNYATNIGSPSNRSAAAGMLDQLRDNGL